MKKYLIILHNVAAFKSSVLRSLQAHEEMLREQLILLRVLVGRRQADDDDEEITNFEPLSNEVELKGFNSKLISEPQFRKQLVIICFMSHFVSIIFLR